MVVGSLLDLEVASFFWISITAQVDIIGVNSGVIPYGSDETRKLPLSPRQRVTIPVSLDTV